MKFATLCFMLSLVCCLGSASRILFLFPSPSKSHLIVVKGLSTTLAERGHDVTVVSPFPLDKPMKNYRDIKVEVPQDMLDLSSSMVTEPNKNLFKMFPRLMRSVFEMGNGMLQMDEFRKVMNEEKFDLVVIGMFFNNYLLGVADHFKCPTIMLSVSGAMTFTNILMGNPLAVEAARHPMSKGKVETFADRLKNFLVHGTDFAMLAYLNYEQKKNYDLNFPHDRYISFDEAQRNISLVLLNSHFSQGNNIRPYVPGMIEVGGLQVKPHVDKLPEKIQSWVDGANDGVVFFSLGSNAKTTYLPRKKIDILLSVFSKLKQRVVMKWESDELKGKPANVLISKWVPQDDLLAHPNVKLFISHCGLGSVAESKYHGVPIVAMPLGIDQVGNADTIESEGWAIKVDFEHLNEKDLAMAIKEVLNNPKYLTTVKQISELYRDRPLNARDTAVFWVEYVIRHRGAKHLRYPGADLNFFQYNSVDVILFLVAIIYVSLKISFLLLKFAARTICGVGRKKEIQGEKKAEKKPRKKTN